MPKRLPSCSNYDNMLVKPEKNSDDQSIDLSDEEFDEQDGIL